MPALPTLGAASATQSEKSRCGTRDISFYASFTCVERGSASDGGSAAREKQSEVAAEAPRQASCAAPATRNHRLHRDSRRRASQAPRCVDDTTAEGARGDDIASSRRPTRGSVRGHTTCHPLEHTTSAVDALRLARPRNACPVEARLLSFTCGGLTAGGQVRSRTRHAFSRVSTYCVCAQASRTCQPYASRRHGPESNEARCPERRRPTPPRCPLRRCRPGPAVAQQRRGS